MSVSVDKIVVPAEVTAALADFRSSSHSGRRFMVLGYENGSKNVLRVRSC